MILDFRGSTKILIVENFRQIGCVQEVEVWEEVRQLRVLEAEDAEEREEIPQFLIKEEVLATYIEKLLDCQK